MINNIKNKYYNYQSGEFMPIYTSGELSNKRDFHLYKLKRAGLMVKNCRAVVNHYTHQQG